MDQNKKVVITFLGNINYDSRSLNIFNSLNKRGYDTTVICFKNKPEPENPSNNNIKFIHLSKEKSSLFFYLKFAFKLYKELKKTSADIYFAEDIYTLPFVYFALRKKKPAKIIYDSRELYGYLAGLSHKKIHQQLLRKIEEIFIKKVEHVLVTGPLEPEILNKEYGISNISVIKNLPVKSLIKNPVDLRNQFNISNDKKILIYQGVILHGRGLKIIFEVLQKTKNYILIILGEGEYKNYFEELAGKLNIKNKVIFAGRVHYSELLNYTAGADCGFAIIENVSLSYFYALPNKLFEYVQAGIPVIASNFPQMQPIVDEYKIGVTVDPENDLEIIDSLDKILNDSEFNNQIKQNCKLAAEELNWENEIEKLFKIIE